MNVTVAKTAGFCFGVKRAVEKVYEQIQKTDKPIYTYGPIIHNEEVVKDLKKKGVEDCPYLYQHSIHNHTETELKFIAVAPNIGFKRILPVVGFEKKEMVSVDGLTESQKGIVDTILFEFHDTKQAAVGFSERQQAIMSALMKEFSKKK